jgi:hypothetical protein
MNQRAGEASININMCVTSRASWSDQAEHDARSDHTKGQIGRVGSPSEQNIGVVKAPGTAAFFCKVGKRSPLHRKETDHHMCVCKHTVSRFQFFGDRMERNAPARMCNGLHEGAQPDNEEIDTREQSIIGSQQ